MRRQGETETGNCGHRGSGTSIQGEQAQLHLQVYDQRRETKLRQARDRFGKNYIVNNIDDATRIAPMGSETGAYVGMVIGYWEQACALLNYGLLHEDLFFETSSESCGRHLNPSFRRFASFLSTSRSLCTSKRRRSATRRGRNTATRVISPRRGNSCNRCAVRHHQRPKPDSRGDSN